MDYREFTGAVEDQMNRRLKGGVQASLYTAVKNNGKERTGVLIESPGINISPTIYLEEYFEDYQKGKCLGMIVDEILGFYDSIKREGPWDCEMLKNYDGVKDRIVFKLVNTLKNRKFLSTVPHRSYLDLSVVFYVLLEVTADGTAAMTVSERHMEQWKVTTDILWSDALRNVKRLLPAEFVTMNHALKEMLRGREESEVSGNDSGNDSGNLLLGKGTERDGMYILSNSLRSYGAACIAYPHILEMIGEILRRDYYVLPSSVHEVIIVPWSPGLDIRELDEMVREINVTQVAEEEVLSSHAYLYRRSTGTLCGGNARQNGRAAG